MKRLAILDLDAQERVLASTSPSFDAGSEARELNFFK